MKTAFLDSSVLFTAVNSPSGGSAKLFTIKDIKLMTSRLVLTEVERNIRKKLRSYHLNRFFMLAEKIEIINQIPDKKIILEAKKVTAEKDSIILAESKKINCEFVISLDKKHFLTPQASKFLKPKKILTPKMLLEIINK